MSYYDGECGFCPLKLELWFPAQSKEYPVF